MTKEKIEELIEELVGDPFPVGETNHDKVALDRTKTKGYLFESLAQDLIALADFTDRPEFSVQSVGYEAYGRLNDMYETLERFFEERNEKKWKHHTN